MVNVYGASTGTGTPTVLITWPDYPLADGELGAALERAGLAIRMARASSSASVRPAQMPMGVAEVNTIAFPSCPARATRSNAR